jgi:hypothetical protein
VIAKIGYWQNTQAMRQTIDTDTGYRLMFSHRFVFCVGHRLGRCQISSSRNNEQEKKREIDVTELLAIGKSVPASKWKTGTFCIIWNLEIVGGPP